MISVDLMLESPDFDAGKKKIILKKNNVDSVIVRPNEEYTLTVGLRRINNSKTLKAHSPMFLKGKDESWFLILGDIQNKELWALKRVSGINSQQRYHQLQFTTPSSLGKFVNFYIFSYFSSLEFLKIKN